MQAVAAVTHTADPRTGIETWETGREGVQIRLTQILPGQARGFYLARGFDTASADRIAHSCVFQTVLKNESAPAPVRFNLRNWVVRTGKDKRPPKLEPDWRDEWDRRRVTPQARLAFRWAQFPLEHVYETGDWNMGMTMYDLPPGAVFDLTIIWQAGGKEQRAVITGLRCAREAKP